MAVAAPAQTRTGAVSSFLLSVTLVATPLTAFTLLAFDAPLSLDAHERLWESRGRDVEWKDMTRVERWILPAPNFAERFFGLAIAVGAITFPVTWLLVALLERYLGRALVATTVGLVATLSVIIYLSTHLALRGYGAAI
jgi:hypothetical protein